jgi:hypothetical protein
MKRHLNENILETCMAVSGLKIIKLDTSLQNIEENKNVNILPSIIKATENNTKTITTNIPNINSNKIEQFSYSPYVYNEEKVILLKDRANLNDWSCWGKILSRSDIKNILCKTLSRSVLQADLIPRMSISRDNEASMNLIRKTITEDEEYSHNPSDKLPSISPRQLRKQKEDEEKHAPNK